MGSFNEGKGEQDAETCLEGVTNIWLSYGNDSAPKNNNTVTCAMPLMLCQNKYKDMIREGSCYQN